MKVFENISLKDYNTFGIDVKARRVVVLEPGDEVPALDGEVLILGGGSNMVFARDFDGTVVTLARSSVSPRWADSSPNRGEELDGAKYQEPTVTHSSVSPDGAATSPNLGEELDGVCGGVVVSAWGGMVMDDLVQWTLDQGFYGLENLSAIPGTVGASAVQNVGAYGVEAKDFIEGVEAYDLQERRHCRFSNADCRFAYRWSMFKECPGRYLILRVSYRLNREYNPNLSYKALEGLPHDTAQRLREAITELRWGKLPRPEENGSAGSFFKNPVVDEATYLRLREQYADMPEAHRSPVGGEIQKSNDKDCREAGSKYKLSAGWLIDRAGWKGCTRGGAGVWPKNALVLYNAGGCTGEEVVTLAAAIQQDVKQKFGVHLEPEAIII